MTKKGIGAQQKTVCWSCTVHLVLGGLLGAGSLWPLNTMRTPGNNCWIWTAAESLASSVWTLGLLSKLYPYSLTTSGVDVIQKQFDGKKLQEIARLWSLFFFGHHEDPWVCCQSKQAKGCGKKRKLQRKALRLAVFSMLFGLGFLALFFLLFPLLLGFRVLLLLWSVAFWKNPPSLFLFEKIDGCTSLCMMRF